MYQGIINIGKLSAGFQLMYPMFVSVVLCTIPAITVQSFSQVLFPILEFSCWFFNFSENNEEGR